MKKIRYPGIVLLALLPALLLQGCVGMAVVGAGAAAMSAMDRRTTGVQIEDERIELRRLNRIGERFGDKAHINVTSYNRNVLLTGEVPDAAARGGDREDRARRAQRARHHQRPAGRGRSPR